jgi:hypothetical protein
MKINIHVLYNILHSLELYTNVKVTDVPDKDINWLLNFEKEITDLKDAMQNARHLISDPSILEIPNSVISDTLHSMESSHGLIDVSLINHKDFPERTIDFSFEIDSLLNEIKNRN